MSEQGNPRCELCPKPQRAAVVRIRFYNASRAEKAVCSMHLGRAIGADEVGGGPPVEIIEWLNEVAQRRWEDDVAAGAVPRR